MVESSDVKCRRYIRGSRLRISFICALNQNPTRMTIEKVMYSCRMQFSLFYAKNRRVMLGSVLAVSSVAGTFEVLSFEFVTVLFVLQINNQLD